ncbi:MAG: hypothetical protein ACI841_001211 [Planctomycetota bacterium]|jgi:hypothetical protein
MHAARTPDATQLIILEAPITREGLRPRVRDRYGARESQLTEQLFIVVTVAVSSVRGFVPHRRWCRQGSTGVVATFKMPDCLDIPSAQTGLEILVERDLLSEG